ncbi:MAG: hypothetical protein PWQ97_530 [Tepidanaerobacteraceae bacterium]|nr:hypothetical protein [Tepidanaerobacteraceae bacterium]
MIILLATGCFHKKSSDAVKPGAGTPNQQADQDLQTPGKTPPNLAEKPFVRLAIKGIKDDSLGLPVSVYQDKDGNTYVLDLYSTDGLVKVFDYQGKYRFKLAPLKAAESQPVDVAVDGEGCVYVADLGLRAVFKYDTENRVEKIQPQEEFYPRSIAVDSKGNLVVLSFDRVYKFSPSGRVFSFGESGEKEGQFGAAGSEFYTGPSGICVDEEGNIYVADTLNSRIQKFSPEGKFRKEFPLHDAASPQDVAVGTDGSVFTLTSSGSLVTMGSDGRILNTKELSLSSQNGWGVGGIAIGRENTLLVAATDQHMVKVMSGGKQVYAIKKDMSNGFICSHNIALDNGRLVIIGGDPFSSDDLNNRVLMFDAKGNFLNEIVPGYSQGRYFGPRDAVFAGDNIYLLDLDIISVFDRKGNFITSFGGRGEEPGDFGVYDNYGQEQGPAGIAVDNRGNIVVSDTYNDRIQKISVQGRYKGGFEVSAPGPVTTDSEGNIYILLPEQAKVVKFSGEGEKVLEFGKPGTGNGEFFLENGEGEMQGPDGIAVDEQSGRIYVSDTAAHRIQVFDSSGIFIKSIGRFGTDENGLYYPRDLAVDKDGFLWVADSGNHRVVCLDVK